MSLRHPQNINIDKIQKKLLGFQPTQIQEESNIQQINQIIQDLCDTDYKVGRKHMDDSCIFVRPSGNPLNNTQWEQMMTSDDITVKSNKLVSINKMHINGQMAYVCYTSHGKFTYKGKENDDIAVLTSILEKKNGVWKVVFGQRSTGRKPEDQLPVF